MQTPTDALHIQLDGITWNLNTSETHMVQFILYKIDEGQRITRMSIQEEKIAISSQNDNNLWQNSGNISNAAHCELHYLSLVTYKKGH